MSGGFHESEVLLASEFSRHGINCIRDEPVEKVRIESPHLFAARDASKNKLPRHEKHYT